MRLALMLTSGGNSWVGYRDTFEVDGVRVRDRDVRLQLMHPRARLKRGRWANNSEPNRTIKKW